MVFFFHLGSRFSKHAGARTVADLLGRGQQHPWFPAQMVYKALKACFNAPASIVRTRIPAAFLNLLRIL